MFWIDLDLRGSDPLEVDGQWLIRAASTFNNYADENSVPDDCETTPCPAEMSGNGIVGAEDLANLLAAWSTDPGGPRDLDGSGSVGSEDLAELLAQWGECR